MSRAAAKTAKAPQIKKLIAEKTTTPITYLPLSPGHPTVMNASAARIPRTAEAAMPVVASPCTLRGRDDRGGNGGFVSPGRRTTRPSLSSSGPRISGTALRSSESEFWSPLPFHPSARRRNQRPPSPFRRCPDAPTQWRSRRTPVKKERP